MAVSVLFLSVPVSVSVSVSVSEPVSVSVSVSVSVCMQAQAFSVPAVMMQGGKKGEMSNVLQVCSCESVSCGISYAAFDIWKVPFGI